MSLDFDTQVLGRLPLAESLLRLLDYALPDETLQDIFQQHRGRSYERVLTFPFCVKLVADALLKHDAACLPALQQARADGRLTTSDTAFYRKINRVPIPLTLAAFDAASSRLQAVRDQLKPAYPLPTSLQRFQAIAFDGKKIKYVPGRLEPLRGLHGNIYGGKLLVAMEMATRQALVFEAHEDGEKGDNPLLPGMVQRVRALPANRTRLWVADRAFCDYTSLPLLAEQDEYFAIRFKTCCKFVADPEKPPRPGVDREGRAFTEAWGTLDGQHVRLIVVERTDEPFQLVTNLSDADRYAADDLLELYRHRWDIETMFQQVVETFELRHLIGSYPEATVLQAMLSLLIYDLTLLIRDVVAEQSKRKRKSTEVSTKKLFADMVGEAIGLLKVVGTKRALALLAASPTGDDAGELVGHLRRLLNDAWRPSWIKSPTRKGASRARTRAYLCGGHSSVAKILKGEHKTIPCKQPDT